MQKAILITGILRTLIKYDSRIAASLTTHPADVGASPEWASVLAAVEALGDRASAAEGGVRHLSNNRRIALD